MRYVLLLVVSRQNLASPSVRTGSTSATVNMGLYEVAPEKSTAPVAVKPLNVALPDNLRFLNLNVNEPKSVFASRSGLTNPFEPPKFGDNIKSLAESVCIVKSNPTEFIKLGIADIFIY